MQDDQLDLISVTEKREFILKTGNLYAREDAKQRNYFKVYRS